MSGIEQPNMIAHYPEALNLCMSQWYSAPNFQKLLQICCEQIQALEDATTDLMNYDNLDNAFGDLLDKFGALLGQNRMGLDDTSYRALLYIKVARNSSRGTPEELINIFSRLMGGSKVFYEEAYPATALLQALNGQPIFPLPTVREIMEAARSAGVKLELTLTDGNPFGFDGDPGASGFGSSTDPTVGGDFSASF